jgi:hypothetical protein
LTGTTVPKPPAQRRRRNNVPPSRAERRLPASGRSGVAPDPPVPLGAAGMRWWSWAWSTPQATMWTHEGFSEALGKRAELEDLWETGAINPMVDPLKILAVMMRLDDGFGFTPRAAAQLHLSFEDAEPEDATPAAPITDIRDRLKGLGS